MTKCGVGICGTLAARMFLDRCRLRTAGVDWQVSDQNRIDIVLKSCARGGWREQ
jgi:hypothetical protein